MFGLIGKKLSHSFSKKYFTERFQKLNLSKAKGYIYTFFELEKIEDFEKLIANNTALRGLNVTIPYKKSIIPFLNELDPIAKEIGAVNTIKIEKNGKKIGYNTDYIGFKSSLEKWLYENTKEKLGFKGKALILGTGGSAQAVRVALEKLEDIEDVSKMKIKFDFASSSVIEEQQKAHFNILPYSEIDISNYKLIINTTPLGMYPNTDGFPPLSEENYSKINENYFLYDLVYNPEETLFLQKGKKKGAKTINGLEMLYGQAEASAQIWGI